MHFRICNWNFEKAEQFYLNLEISGKACLSQLNQISKLATWGLQMQI